MIFDGHTHLFGPGHVGGSFLSDAKKAWGDGYELQTTPEDHWNVYRHADGAIVLAFHCPQTGVVVPNEYVAEYVEAIPAGCSASPASIRMRRTRRRSWSRGEGIGLVGLKLAPIYQNFYPGDRAYFPLYAKAESSAFRSCGIRARRSCPKGSWTLRARSCLIRSRGHSLRSR